MKGKRVFVSGGAGVIGREMIPRLVEQGATVLVGDIKPRPEEFPKEVIYRRGDLNNMTRKELERFSPDSFIHLAATFERSEETKEFWEENFWHNVRLSHHLMTLAKEVPSLKRVVFASSYLIYHPSLYQFGENQASPVSLKETDPILPRNLTGMAKLAHEIELRFIDKFYSSKFSTVCARIYRGYGRNSRDVISRWIRALLDKETITVYRPEGLFDYVYAADTAEGLIRLAGADEVTGIINLGTGRSRRVQDVVDVLGTHFPDMRVSSADSDLPFEASQADITLLEKKIGWVPEYDLERAIPEMIAFERAKKERVNVTTVTPKILVSSASKKVPLVKAMQSAARKFQPDAKVVAGDMDPKAITAFVADEFWEMPRLSAVKLDDLIRECKHRGITAILPTRDGELAFWAEHRDAFQAENISVMVSNAGAVDLCVDKLRFSEFGEQNSLPIIPSALDINDIAAERLVVKERFGAGSRSLGLNLDRKAAIEHARSLDAPIYQPFVAGEEVSVDAWLDASHRVKGVVLRRREYVVNGESQITTTFSNGEIERGVIRVLEALQLSGPVVLQAFVDEHGSIHVIECNARFGGASTTGIAAGLDSLYWSILEAHGCDLEGHPFVRSDEEVRQVRVPTDIYV